MPGDFFAYKNHHPDHSTQLQCLCRICTIITVPTSLHGTPHISVPADLQQASLCSFVETHCTLLLYPYQSSYRAAPGEAETIPPGWNIPIQLHSHDHKYPPLPQPSHTSKCKYKRSPQRCKYHCPGIPFYHITQSRPSDSASKMLHFGSGRFCSGVFSNEPCVLSTFYHTHEYIVFVIVTM